MATLHIEHAITDFPTWKAAFDRFAAKRAEAGVTAHRISLLHDDPAYLVLQLDFPTAAQAEAFKDFLEARVWSTPVNSPGLAATPRARVLVAAPAQ
jgi:hypothetical protein